MIGHGTLIQYVSFKYFAFGLIHDFLALFTSLKSLNRGRMT